MAPFACPVQAGRGRFGDHSALAGVMPAAVGRTSPSVGRRDPLDHGRRPRWEPLAVSSDSRLGPRETWPIVRRYETQVSDRLLRASGPVASSGVCSG